MKINRFTNHKDRSNPFMRWIAARLMRYIQSTPWHYGNDESELYVGKNVSLANTVINTRSGTVYIGNNVMFGHNSFLLAGSHALVPNSLNKRPTDKNGHSIVIEDGVWIASGVIVIGPVKIGRNAVIASGSVVVHDVPSNVLVAGNPARIIRAMI